MQTSGREHGGVILRFADHLFIALNSLERAQLLSPSPDPTALIRDFKRSG